MLSEQNRFHRVWSDHSINPRGELWKKDEQNFGCKLMKKMGWKEENGLGKNGNGITAPIRVVQTRDNEGLGFSKHISDYSWNWLSHQDDYSTLLKQLREQHWTTSDSGSCGDQNSSVDVPHISNVGKRRKASRKRERYQRHIEGKKMSNRSETDWQCILGKKNVQSTSLVTDSSTAAVNNHELLVTSTFNSHEYFMEKKLKLERNHGPHENCDVEIPDKNMEKEMPEDNFGSRFSERDGINPHTSHSPVNKLKRKRRTIENRKQRRFARKQKRKRLTTECGSTLNSLTNTKVSLDENEVNGDVGQVPSDSANSKPCNADKQTPRKRKKRTKEKGLERKLARKEKKKMLSLEQENISKSLSGTKLSESFREIEVLTGSSSNCKPRNAVSRTESCMTNNDNTEGLRSNTRWNHSNMGNKAASKYQFFLEAIKHDPIFKTCNLLSIKGYGNR